MTMTVKELLPKAKDHLRMMDGLDIKIYRELDKDKPDYDVIEKLRKEIYKNEALTRAYLEMLIGACEKEL